METCMKFESCTKPAVNRSWLIQRLLEIPAEIARAESDLLKLTEQLEEAKQRLADKEMSLILEGKIEGKNENERKANIRNLTAAERAEVQEAERDLAAYKAYLNGKLNEFSALKTIARLISKEVE